MATALGPVALASESADWQQFATEMAATRAVLADHFRDVNERSGMAANLQARLDAESGEFSATARPQWLTAALYLEYAKGVADLDARLVAHLASGRPQQLHAIRGMDDIAFRSVADGKLQPAGVFVPPSYDGRTPAPLVIFLHGYTQTEADEIASPWIRQAASATGAVVIAPYARGDTHYADPAPREIYQLVDLAERELNIDKKRVYLAGHSMGGFGVFDVGRVHPEIWAALFCASGALTEANRDASLQAFHDKPVYVVQGSEDSTVPPEYARRTVEALRSGGIRTGYYEEPGGGHTIGTIRKAFVKAWTDMLKGVMPS
jgi:dipeptidyl aminopeptidase/acylaminoacyl peptidase